MKKQLLRLMAVLIIMTQVYSCAMAASSSKSYVNTAIKKYKIGNYTGCLQDTQAIVRRDPSNAVAYYYMAMSYAQAGKRDEAIKAYARVLSLKPNARLSEYATTGKRCLETPDKCRPETGTSSDIDKLIAAPFSDGLSNTVRTDVERIHLNNVKNQINSGKDLDDYQLRKFKEYGNNRSKVETNETAAQKQPTNDEIVAALKVLTQAGLNPYGQTTANPYTQAAANPYAQAMNESPEIAQLNMLMGENGQSKNNNSMMNMMPFMLAQSKNGTNNSYSPQLMQAVLMNSMMPDFNLKTNEDN